MGIESQSRRVERRERWLWFLAVLVTLVLTVGIVSLSLPVLHSRQDAFYLFQRIDAALGLFIVVLLFDIYVLYQQLQISRVRRELSEREQLFRLATENAVDMIAVVDRAGRRIYNSPAYEKALGYSPQELQATSPFEQIHPDDRQRVIDAAKEAYESGVGCSLEYRMRHKDGTWRTLESTASVIRDEKGPLEKLVIVNRDITARKRVEEEMLASRDALHFAATRDGLTGLLNRGTVLSQLQQELKRAAHQKTCLGIMLIDLDYFKKINDTRGHLAGDEALRCIGALLQSLLRKGDSAGRYGGEEFLIIMPGCGNADLARRAEMIRVEIAALNFPCEGPGCSPTASIGVATFDWKSPQEPEVLLHLADAAMYEAKRSGRNRVVPAVCDRGSSQVASKYQHSSTCDLQDSPGSE